MKKKFSALLPSLFLCLLIFLVFLFFYQRRPQEQKAEPLQATKMLLNTVVTVTIYDSTDSALLDGAMKLCADYEQIFSRTAKDSELYRLNHRQNPNPDGSFTVSKELAELLKQGLFYSELSKGAFDISLAPLTSLWDFGSDRHQVPTDAQLQDALGKTGYAKIHLDGQKVTFDDEEVQLDLGAIAKGYIADAMKDYLLENNVKSAIINLGGNVLCVGKKPDGKPFKIGVQKPFADRNETIAVLDLADRSVVSSGIYERFFEKDGKFYHHILNPATGYPHENNLSAVTIISDRSTDGDALSTTCFVLGLEKGLELIESQTDVQAVFITKDGEVHTSKNLVLPLS